jgi:hypothetical protein
MPAAKMTRTPARKTTSRSVKTTTRTKAAPPARRTLSASHKKALAGGRAMSATVNNYLIAIGTPRKRGRKVARATLERRLAEARSRVKIVTGVEKVVAAQTVRDLQKQLSRPKAATGIDAASLEAAFVKIAKTFSENRNLSYAAWRDAGVPAAVLRRAGVVRTRS